MAKSRPEVREIAQMIALLYNTRQF